MTRMNSDAWPKPIAGESGDVAVYRSGEVPEIGDVVELCDVSNSGIPTQICVGHRDVVKGFVDERDCLICNGIRAPLRPLRFKLIRRANTDPAAAPSMAEGERTPLYRVVRKFSNGCEVCPDIWRGDKWIATIPGAPYLGKDGLAVANEIVDGMNRIPRLCAEIERLTGELATSEDRRELDTLTAENAALQAKLAEQATVSAHLEHRLRAKVEKLERE